jgi:hypothetical protein
MSEDLIEDQILKMLSSGSKRPGEIEKELLKQGISRQTFYRHLRSLRDIDRRVRPTLSWQPGVRPTVMYELVPEGSLSNPAEQAKENISKFYDLLNRYPTIQELALKIGVTPTEAEEQAYKTSKETGWRPPTEEEIEESRIELGETLILAARLKANPKEDLTDGRYLGYNQEFVERAHYYEEKYPELLPILTENNFGILEWPEAAKRYLGGHYDAMVRSRPYTRSSTT